MKIGKTIVIGGGAAGLMAAGRAAGQGAEVFLLEKMGQTGRKIGISGKGRCNLTNDAALEDFLVRFGKNGRFLRQCFQQFFSSDLISFFAEKNLPMVTERGGRIFPESGRALDVVRVLNNWLQTERVTVKKSAAVSAIQVKDGRVTGVVCNGVTMACANVILATGGKSYPRTGSTGDGYTLAESLGHTIVPLRPALVPLVSRDPRVHRMAGLELRNVQVRVYLDGKRKGQEFGELAFTGFGLTGPVILTLSSAIVDALNRGGKVTLSLDLKPALDEKKLDNRLIRDLISRAGEPIDSILRGLLPQQMVPICLESCDLPPTVDTRNFPAKMRKRLVQWLKDFRVEISGYRDYDEAIVTAGGVSLKEIDPTTMESRLVKGLYIVGELLDLQADTGGYNLQAAFSTGWVAGSSIS
ncbi:NAD(P)/FAD-dependent oxidoreductase [Desulfopila sp. IMCC35006]|uniref:NAD(P)/FAD-dependent oxidoreductase n=1 Tax=Desulfopila sp. IMCC35006 TaxID=2569542 RepID=UPI0010ACBBB4|nr:NAD(P)/FAD-dependent oxidoreductase [Desulfopila sp. IMCC35006]TKB28606.1 NAD(P)/FAD-dependent oxidoreductase [Desulfopila sp. IMCC35006]